MLRQGAVEAEEMLPVLLRKEEAQSFAGRQHLFRAAQMKKLLGEVKWIN